VTEVVPRSWMLADSVPQKRTQYSQAGNSGEMYNR
jgi:hypothetical protein